MVGASALRGSIRWAFNTKAWDPTEQEWLFASRCITVDDKERINKFVFKDDAKASMAGCLMTRKLACMATGDSNDKISILRNKYGRPCIHTENLKIDFNVSHQGNFTVLAGEVDSDGIVGVDVMSLNRKTGHDLSEFFRLMNKTCSNDEWSTILAQNTNEEKASLFFRHWCLKESYLKGIGVGVRTDMRHVSFRLGTLTLSTSHPVTDTVLEVDRVRNPAWTFHEWLLDSHHCVAVALSTCSGAPSNFDPVPFTMLSWPEIVKDALPILSPDIPYTQTFMGKEERA